MLQNIEARRFAAAGYVYMRGADAGSGFRSGHVSFRPGPALRADSCTGIKGTGRKRPGAATIPSALAHFYQPRLLLKMIMGDFH